ncbi:MULTISPECIES: energy-coupling factor transporter transmembrane component T [unclassified Ruminococcus]|uniref:energy-coupling factor transporter transmembrane component T n=1 Tax=unclassified Ruminococcus TaxID=2608920 RepID=UPI002108CEB4|nr:MULTISPECIES: energy-coupling factor transporter transmembrane component T [unclassified Ruminococcus]MCQ4022060.1 energy-coupling factor transporter transmembrane protein EcfT [Ruminococcus sp. zg-924]MCQ4114380.1 energy-coupling factor transporter transmembrane protein EcfT [Ruminococcus sp. zg-921]
MQRFSAFHPISSFLYLISAVCITMFSRNIVIAAISIVAAFVFYLSLKATQSVWIYPLIFLLTAITNPIFSHNGVTVLFFLNGNPITLEAFVYGVYLGAVIIAVLLWFSCYNTVITSDKFLCLFGAVMPKAALTISMALRLVPQFISGGREMLEIQNSIIPIRCGIIKRVKKHIAIFSCLITRSLEGAVEQLSSMKARGYGLHKRVSYSRFRFTFADFLLLIYTITGFVYIVFFSGLLNYNYYPEMDKINFDVSYILCAVFLLMPTAINLWGEIKWKYSISKI